MRRDLLGMSLLELLDNVVILSVILHLSLELFQPLLETLFGVHHFQTHVGHLHLILLLYLLLALLHLNLEIFELFLGFFLLLEVSLLHFLYHGLHVLGVPSFFKGILLPAYDAIGLSKYRFDLLLVSAREGVLVLDIFFILRVQVKDHLSQLCDFLRHLVVHVLGGTTC